MPRTSLDTIARLALLVVLVSYKLAPAQEQRTVLPGEVSADKTKPPDITSHVLLVQVPTFVAQPSSASTVELTAEDFTLTDDGVPQRLRVEQDSSRPLSLVLVMQTGGDGKLMFPEYKNLEAVVEALLAGSPHRVAVVSFDSRVEGATPFTADLAEWKDALDQPEEGDYGAAIFDGVAYGVTLLSKEPTGNRRVVLLISQPEDQGSKISSKELVSLASNANVTVISLTFSPELASFRAQLKAPPHLNPPLVVTSELPPTQAYFNLGEPLRLLLGGLRHNAALQVANVTGGESLAFKDAKQLSAAVNTLSNHLENRYLLTFSPSSDKPGVHALEVRVRSHPEWGIKSRRTYWNGPEAGTTSESSSPLHPR